MAELIELYSNHNGSDKTYICEVTQDGADWVMTAWYGPSHAPRRSHQEKCRGPSLDAARHAARELARSKQRGASRYQERRNTIGQTFSKAPITPPVITPINPMLTAGDLAFL